MSTLTQLRRVCGTLTSRAAACATLRTSGCQASASAEMRSRAFLHSGRLLAQQQQQQQQPSSSSSSPSQPAPPASNPVADEGDNQQVYEPWSFKRLTRFQPSPQRIASPYDMPAVPKGSLGFFDVSREYSQALRKATAVTTIPLARNGMTVETFLTRIGRNSKEHIAKFPSWDHLFGFSDKHMRSLGITVSQRRYIKAWCDRYARGMEPFEILPKPPKKKKDSKKKSSK